MFNEILINDLEESQIMENNNFYILGRHDNFWESTCEEHFFENEINLYKAKEELIENEIKNNYKKKPESIYYLWNIEKTRQKGRIIFYKIKKSENYFPFIKDKVLHSIMGTKIENGEKFYFKDFNAYSIEDLKKDIVLKKYIDDEENIVDKGDDILEMYFDFEKFESYEEFVERINARIYTFILDEKEFDDKKVKYIRAYGIEVRNKKQCRKVIKKFRKVLTDNFINEKKTKKIYFWDNLKNIFRL